jgi:two-component system NtrC family sensor kinase
MLERISNALVSNFRVVMLVVTSLLLVVGFVSIHNQLNWIDPHLGLIAVEGKDFIHLTTDGSGRVEKQSKIKKLSEEELSEGNRQLLFTMTGRNQLEGGDELVVSWDFEFFDSGRRELRYERVRDGAIVDTWYEKFDSYERMFRKVVCDLGIDSSIDVTYQPQFPSATGFLSETLSIAARRVDPPLSSYLETAVGLAFLAVGFVIYFSAARRRAPHATHLFLVCLFFYVFFVFHFTVSRAPLAWIIFWCDQVAFLFAPVVLYHFFYLFRHDRFAKVWTPRTPLLYLPSLALLSAVIASLSSQRLPIWTTASMLVKQAPYYDILFKAELLLFGFLVVTGLVTLLKAYGATSSVEKKLQIKWLFWGTGIGLMPTVLFSFPMTLLNLDTRVVDLVVSVPLFLMPICLAHAIFRYKLMDVEVVFKRGFVYFVSSFSMVGIYLLLMLGLNVFGSPLGNTTVIILGGVLILLASLFSHRIKDQVQSFFDKLLYRDFYNFRSTLQLFSRELSYERDLERLLGKISERIRETFRVSPLLIFRTTQDRRHFVLAHSSVEAFETAYLGKKTSSNLMEHFAAGTPVALEQLPEMPAERVLAEAGIRTLIPFLSLGEVVGFMALGNKVDGDILNTDDLELLASLASRAAVSIDNALLYQDLQRRAEEMGRLKEFSENIVESVNSGICVVDNNWIVQSWNHPLENLFGIARAGAIGKPFLQLLPDSIAALVGRYLQGTGGEELVHSLYKVKAQLPNGRGKVLNIASAPLSGNPDGAGSVIIIDDITDWVAMEEQLLQKEKLASLGLMAAGVAHEVNTPLTGIASYTQILQRKLTGDAEARDLLGKVERQAFRASRIINNLLSFSRQGSGEIKEFDFNEMIKESLVLIESQLKSAHVRVATDCDPELHLVLGDKGRLQQVVINLLLNARDAMPDGGEITIRTFKENGNIVFAVSDTGVGIPKDKLSKIYDPFFTTKGVGKGTGLGLSVTYGIIQDHFGSIEVESEEQKGTTFRVTLPSRGS